MTRACFYREIESDLRFYQGIDLLVRAGLVCIPAILLVLLQSYLLVVGYIVLAGLLTLIGYALQKALLWFLAQWGINLLPEKTYLDERIEFKRFGRFKANQLQKWLTEYAANLDIKYAPQLAVSDCTYQNAYALRTRVLHTLLHKNEIVLYRPLFGNLSEEELKAVLCHELGHHRYELNLCTVTQLILALWNFGRTPYRHCLEYLADRCAVELVGIVPVANALLKISTHNEKNADIQLGFFFMAGKLKLSAPAVAELNDLLSNSLPWHVEDKKTARQHVARVIQKYFECRGLGYKGLGKRLADEHARELINERSENAERLVRWKEFDSIEPDGSLCRTELERLSDHLRENPGKQLFYAGFAQDGARICRTHPTVRDRIVNALKSREQEAYQRAHLSKTGYERSPYCVS